MKPTFRASELARILHCNGSARLVPLVAKPEDTEVSTEGTFLHHYAHSRHAAEFGATGDLGGEPQAPANLSFSRWIGDFYVDTVSSEIPREWSWEMEVGLEHEFNRFILTGHPDDVGISPDVLEAIGADLKCGYIAVEAAESNIQMLVYVVLLVLAYPTLRKITWLVVQPRNDPDDGHERVTRFTLEGDALAKSVAYLETEINKAIDNGMELDTGVHACKYCPVGLSLQCPAQIQEREAMKHTLTEEAIAAITSAPNDAIIADWALSATMLKTPLDEAVELAKERIAAVGYIDSPTGQRLTVKTTKGSISIPDKTAFRQAVEVVLPERDRQDKCISWSKSELIGQIAEARDIPKTSKKGVSGDGIYGAQLAPLTEQGERRILVVT